MKQILLTTVALGIGLAVGYGLNQHQDTPAHDHSASSSNEPLYWVAPMDPNYKRDQPGKSPMGMDLIPVYEADLAGANDTPGTVYIDPAVENNLGVKTAQTSYQTLTQPIETVGYIGFDQEQYWQINLRVSGWVETLNVHSAGEKVRKGDVLFTLYSPELVKAQEELLNAARSNRKAMISGAKQRLRTLGMDNSQINQVIRSGKAIQNIAVKAPADGIIDELTIREGAFLSPQQKVIGGGSLDTVWVEAEVFERQSAWIEAGSKVDMVIANMPGAHWQGRVDYVYPVLDPKTRSMRVRMVFDNPDLNLKPNMYASLSIAGNMEQESLVVPRQAVIRNRDMTRVVLSLGEGKYRSVRIETGLENRDWIAVSAGLNPGDRVVTSAQFMLDSESSQTADLSRINGVEIEKVDVDGLYIAMSGERRVRIAHTPVPEWNWPAMEMDFDVAEGVDFKALASGEPVRFSLKKEKKPIPDCVPIE
jgi:Cu(I)/Ag(I) efflux system membrane fusion protein